MAGEVFPTIAFNVPNWVPGVSFRSFLLQPIKRCRKHPDPLWHCPLSFSHAHVPCAECAHEQSVHVVQIAIALLPERIRQANEENAAARKAALGLPHPSRAPVDGYWFANVIRATWTLPGAIGDCWANVLVL